MAGRRLRVGLILPDGRLSLWHSQAIAAIHNQVASIEVVTVEEDSHPNPVDVVIDFGAADWCDAWVPSRAFRLNPAFGVWRYGFGDGGVVAGGAPGTLARLYRFVGDSTKGIVLQEGWFRAASREAPGTTSVESRVAPWCARALARLAEDEKDVAQGETIATRDCCEPLPPAHGTPRRRIVAGLRRWLRSERWTIGIVPLGIDEVLRRGSLPEPMWLVGQPANRFYADPFPLEIPTGSDAVRLLAEEYRYRGSRGCIAELEVGRDGRLRSVGRRIALPHHASYPFVFRDDGHVFCVPETSRANRLSAFGRAPGTGTWQYDRSLLDGFPAVDATLLRHDDRWWMFCMHRDVENQTELHLFFAPDWRGPWVPHWLNPVKSDARSSRPAGSFFEVDGALYRPAQNCARRYGGGLTINRVWELSERRFREEPVLALNPDPGWSWPDGLHTINSLDGVTVVDGLRVERRFGAGLVRGVRPRSL